jgi:hypothetical protein
VPLNANFAIGDMPLGTLHHPYAAIWFKLTPTEGFPLPKIAAPQTFHRQQLAVE